MLTRFLSVIFSGLSLLNLIVDMSPISLYGKLLEWSKAYDALVESFVRPLFAWIQLYWISISTSEMHLLVIQSIFCAGFIRSDIRYSGRNGMVRYIRFLPLSMLVVLIPALILPGLGGTFGALGCLIFFNFYDPYNDAEFNRIALEEFAAIFLFVCVLIAINYAFFAQ